MTLPQAVSLYEGIFKLEENEIYMQSRAISLAFAEDASNEMQKIKAEELYEKMEPSNTDNLTYTEEDWAACEARSQKYLKKE